MVVSLFEALSTRAWPWEASCVCILENQMATGNCAMVLCTIGVASVGQVEALPGAESFSESLNPHQASHSDTSTKFVHATSTYAMLLATYYGVLNHIPHAGCSVAELKQNSRNQLKAMHHPHKCRISEPWYAPRSLLRASAVWQSLHVCELA